MISLTDLPDSVLSTIISHLTQPSILNLALTSTRLHDLCLAQLYKKILITTIPPLRTSTNNNNKLRQLDFSECCMTCVYGHLNILDPVRNRHMLGMRLDSLITNLSIHKRLVSEVYVFGNKEEYGEENVERIKKLVEVFEHLKVFYVSDVEIREVVDVSKIMGLKSIVIDDDVVSLDDDDGVEEVLVGKGNLRLKGLDKLKSLILMNDMNSYWKWIDENVLIPNVQFNNLEKFKVVFHYDTKKTEQLVKSINWSKITQLELVFGNNPINNEDYIIDSYNLIPLTIRNLQKISIIQNEVYPTHEENEFFDLNTFNFLTMLIDTKCHGINYVSIKHKTPNLGNFIDGMDGYYRRRLELFMITLPKIFKHSTQQELTLLLPNLFQSFANYEQFMNFILWNGCKCKHCDKYLTLLDEYLLYHKYHDPMSGKFKDMNSSHLFTEIGQQLNNRMIQDELLTQLQTLHFPLLNTAWDFHENTNNSHPFKCYENMNVDQGEYDGEDVDLRPTRYCLFNNHVYRSGVPLSVSHYVNQLIEKLINLDRGNAEMIYEENNNDFLNDGGEYRDFRVAFKKVVINGFCYVVDKEMNGTHFYENVYD
ncbi:ROY1 Non-SCF-type F-box protein ROY1 [Candida maltosa Xu316]